MLHINTSSNEIFLPTNISKISQSIQKDLERSYTVYARSLGPPESHTIESAFIRVIS